MGIEVYRGSLDSQATSTGTMVEQQLKAYEALEIQPHVCQAKLTTHLEPL